MRNLLTSVLAFSALFTLPLAIQAQDNKPKHLTFTDKELAVAPTKAVVELSVNFMREKPEYEAELGDQALMGTIVEVLENKDGWARIKSPEPYTAWVDNRGLVMMSDKEIADYLEAPKYICTALRSNIYEEPSLDSRIVSEFILGDIVRIMYKTVTHTKGSLKGYEEGRVVLKKKFVGVVLPSGKTGYVPAKDVTVFYKWAKDKYVRLDNVNAFRKDIVETASRFIGVPYMWGGTSIKNADCSGLTRSVFFANGVLLPRNASQQGRIGENLPLFSAEGDVIWDALLPGDLVFWGREASDGVPAKATHVGIYIGDGRFIHSSFMVRISSLDPSSPDYYDRKPLCARRIAGYVDKKDSGIISVFASPDYVLLK
ncbi:MAG: C40 family peptidase [Bacteroidales bacterium]|nr:C40 family peptidase [Bacteroidales bacterium]